jgi:DNA-binding response OmpR family regulator
MPKECAILEYFMKHPGKGFSLAELTHAVWPDAEGMAGSTVRAWLRNLRLKLADIGQQDYLKTESGYTYKIVGNS